jgi:diguanylate cyclase (GGDEF)-like protein
MPVERLEPLQFGESFMPANIMTKIVEQCLTIDKNCSKIYQKLSQKAETKDMKSFWKTIDSADERHADNWNKLLNWANKGMLPLVFDKPTNVLEELKAINSKVNEMIKRSAYVHEIKKAFLIAFKLEFYLLHPAFETLSQYLRTLSDEKTPVDVYGAKINKLFEALYKYDLVSLELELLGETIYRLWKENKRMAIQSNYDALTEVLNRRGLFNAIKPLSHLAQRNKNNIAIMMIDIDRFKNINDEFGHQFGDEVLRYVARTIKSNIRGSDILGRYGGEEFLVLLSSVEPQSLYEVGEKIRRTVEKGNKNRGGVTISIGSSQAQIRSVVDKELEALINKADEKLLEAKKRGRNRVIV